MDLGIAGKSAIIVGATQGIGLAIAQELAREQARVFIVSRDPANVEAAVEMLRAAGAEAAGTAADSSAPAELDAAVEAATGAHGPPLIAIMAPNASIRGRFSDLDDSAFAAGQQQILMPLVRMSRKVSPAMKAARWGRIVSVGSMSVRMVHRTVAMTVPDTYRLGAVALVKTMADEFGSYGITVNTVAPGSTMTDNARRALAAMAEKAGVSLEAFVAERSLAIPVGRPGRPEEIAAVCAFLCSQRASYVTGQTWLVDGGRVEAPL